MPVVKAQEEIAQIPPGTYECECISTESFYLETDQWGNHDKVRVVVHIDPDSDNPFKLDAICNEKLSPMSTLWAWAEAFGLQPDVGGELDTDDMVGKRALVQVGERKTERGTWARVEKFVPMLKTRAVKVKDTAPAADEPESTVNYLQVNAQDEATIDWTKFWIAAKKHGLNKKHVVDAAGTDDLTKVDPFELMGVLDKLIKDASAPF